MNGKDEKATAPAAEKKVSARDKYPIGTESSGFTVVAVNGDKIIWRRQGPRKTTFVVDSFTGGKLSRITLTNDEAEAYKAAGLEAPKSPQPAAAK